jgi:hypothetical protein
MVPRKRLCHLALAQNNIRLVMHGYFGRDLGLEDDGLSFV